MPFIITFPGASMAEANQYAGDLASALREVDRSLTAEQQRDRQDTQDLGVVVSILLGSASAVAVAQGISAWLVRHSGAKIQIDAAGSVIATNLDSQDAAKIAAAFASRR
ncbi:MAG TPA: hypothetical protein VJ860_13380 [Polyangia bacterium]|nr:hypothetical protein [Polyangia bacterium]